MGAFIYMGQPTSSSLPKAQPNLAFIQIFMLHNVSTSSGALGAETQKNIKVLSNDPKVINLNRKSGAHTKQLTYRSTGGSITGLKESMIASQAYPREFGKAYGRLAASNYHSPFSET
eukprot:5998268-Karenia_brevis.AAC.1